MKQTIYFAVYLAILGALVTAIAYFGYSNLQPIIDANTQQKIDDNIALLFDPADYHQNPDFNTQSFNIDNPSYPLIDAIYQVLDSNDNTYAYIYDMHVQGRNDVIHALIAVDPYTDTILGVAYYQQSETPNIGEKYMRQDAIDTLIGQPVTNVVVDAYAEATTTWNALNTMYTALADHYTKEGVHIDG